jgi:hypothetical protein
MVEVLEDHRDDPVVQEIAAAIFAMTEDEQIARGYPRRRLAGRPRHHLPRA